MDLSTTVHLVNNTLFELKLSAKALKWGYWDTFPLGLLFPKTSSKFVVKDTSLAAAGSEGSVTYSFGGIVIHMKFCDSYSLGGNYAAIELQNQGREKKYEIGLSFTAQVDGGKVYHNYCPPAGHPLVLTFVIDSEYPYFLNDKQFKAMQKEAPNISQNTFCRIGIDSQRYNCIAWSMGIDYAWINPPKDIDNVIKLYASAGSVVHTGASGNKWKANFNYVPVKSGSDDASVDLFSVKVGNELVVDYASRLYDDAFFNTGAWTSKENQGFLVRHERAGLDGSNYGSVTHSLKKVPVTILEDSKDIKYADFVDVYKARHLSIMVEPFDALKITKLNEAIEGLDDELKKSFTKSYIKWRDNCSTSRSSNTYEYTSLDGFQDLINMGKEVIQLIAREMLEEDNFFILVLYENLQKNAKLTITNIEDLLPLENEQSRARRTIHLYLQSL
ncbi:DUF7689 domain-containing protein [bacterium endosymbiont of Bathymodiolus sp. 5 South]|jgi:hypothetical protein|uniref:DUF7689 domain-containing protein n=1 Tax=bacterium endosymbiont of Bathymodiolus sp. 5 South TaxID=1181670 RepID=UPI0010B61EE8|nr:hypothetical protein [bacterium endosymbiont of Bathymodiolus sp. 5 South]VVH55221.1 hypothetical protein BSPCLSOX_706 [uncultured Gammaproteobacteria bacterium]SSC08269.1 hypothetical protein BTURTLESOX_2176 [bacterium endosymbiont of Bathymodiolus sp. 5 South]VVH63418.1 hypothetical protein BSPWISOX_2130 [uncultured Gammaproteobacteria bacterium]VVM19971.1 hypothetical protein BSPWISOXPB_1212 [uncultured Gammaproteobacteria bacterium]VVM20614.1 hypothetical protein BSPWISOXPB_7199 [uncult